MSTEGQTIKCRAAVVWGANNPLTIEEIDVAPPKQGEIRIKIMYTALCHTDTLSWSGKDIEGFFATYPAILGHEGAGIVESVGPGVIHVQPGDKVIPCFIPQCRKCAYCKHGETNLCEFNLENQTNGKMPDGTSRFSCKGQMINHFMGCSTFSEYTVCAAENVTKISQDAPLDTVCVLGCGVGTGYGAAVKSAGVKPGSRCAVWGAGAVGLATVLGCKNAGAEKVVAIDFFSNKLEAAKKFGATECINPGELPKDTDFTDYLVKKYDGGFDYTFDCTGNVKAMRQALEAAHKGWGVSCVVGVAAKNQEISTTPMNLLMGRRWIGSTYGGIKCQDDIPGMVKDHLAGKMHLESFISHRIALEDINKAFDWLLKGESLRTVMSVAAPSPK
ncbi:Protein H24K24.3 a [Aphelenchoides avenae]|nr:Protein H24K24.3 a [Aphelenchus avenae]